MNPRALFFTLTAAFIAVALYGMLAGSYEPLPYLALALLSLVLGSIISTFSRGAHRSARFGGAQSEADVEQLVAAGRKIEAIKLYRQQTGAGLAEAKAHVEALESGQPAPVQGSHSLPLPVELEEDIRTIVAFGNKIEAIKRVRELTGVGLKEAKEYVEGLARR